MMVDARQRRRSRHHQLSAQERHWRIFYPLPSWAHSCVLEICCWLLMTFRPTTTTPPFFANQSHIVNSLLFQLVSSMRPWSPWTWVTWRSLLNERWKDGWGMRDDFVRMWRVVAAAGCFHGQSPKKQVMTRLQSEMRSIGMMRGSLKYFQYTPEVRSSLNEPVRTSTLNLFDSDVKHIDRSGPGLTSLARQWWCANTTIESIFSLYSERYGINENPRKKKLNEWKNFILLW